jgi:hypothetical protein
LSFRPLLGPKSFLSGHLCHVVTRTVLQGKPVTADSGPQALDKGKLRRAVANRKENLFPDFNGRNNIKSQVNPCMKTAYNCSKLHEHNAADFYVIQDWKRLVLMCANIRAICYTEWSGSILIICENISRAAFGWKAGCNILHQISDIVLGQLDDHLQLHARPHRHVCNRN